MSGDMQAIIIIIKKEEI